jgi:ubiquinone/menaquinone biosynthesis C-methylase UbiE
MRQHEIDKKNSAFWNDLCGSNFARNLGITEINEDTLKKYDDAYMSYYPYLAKYVKNENLKGKKVIEIGLGYGTLSQFLVSQGCKYYGLDIAEGPVAMVKDRLKYLNIESEDNVRVGSVLEIPFADESFDYVYSIGCLHHTGNIPKSVAEIYRVLRIGGKAVVMLYNRQSFRQLIQIPIHRFIKKIATHKKNISEFVRSLYDVNSKGEAAPYTEFVSRTDVKRIFNEFSKIKIDSQNFDSYKLAPFLVFPRKLLLNNFGRILGLDLYVNAQK